MKKEHAKSQEECVDLCRTTADECTTCATESEKADMKEVTRLCRECADACQRVVITSATNPDILRSCADACNKCAAECDKFTTDYCKSCAEMCRKCEMKCNSLVLAGSPIVMTIALERTRTSFAKAAILSGLIAGIVFAALEMMLVPIFTGDTMWAPIRMIAAIVMGEGVLPAPGVPATFDWNVVLIAVSLHLVLSMIYATIIGFVLKQSGPGVALLIGALAGLTIYIINFYGFTAAFDWFAMARNWISILSHAVFGIVAALAFVRIFHPNEEKR